MRICSIIAVFFLAFMFSRSYALAGAPYDGYEKCGGCHKSQMDSWKKTVHAKAFDDLKQNNKVEAKKKAKLDPGKDYTKDEKCLTCHTTGYGKKKGFNLDLSELDAEFLIGVTCENCHGAGGVYRKLHRKAGDKFRKKNKTSLREDLIYAGQNTVFEDVCASCHLNYEGSPWKGAKAPFTPFTPNIDPKYAFNFEANIKNAKAMHEHFKLLGVFEGDPITKFRAEFQKDAKEPVEPE